MKKIAIDLTWVRHNKVGGTESCVRNLLKGFNEANFPDIEIYLLLARDNFETFKMYNASCFKHIVCKVNASNQIKRVAWQNIKLGNMLRNYGIKYLIEPIYGMPFGGMKKIKVYVTIHDLQAIHYPEYFSKARVLWMEMNWKHAAKRSHKIIAISDYVKKDIIEKLGTDTSKIITIYNAIDIDEKECDEELKLKRYGVCPREYYYTVSSLLPHKNLKTIVEALAFLNKQKSKSFHPLVISGIGGKAQNEIMEIAKENNIENYIILTSFVDTRERNMLYRYCCAFLFPSVFEGFGMPPLEAMKMGVPVLTTRCTSIEEVTGGLLNYVENPLNYNEWANRMEGKLILPEKSEVEKLLKKYNSINVARQYYQLFLE